MLKKSIISEDMAVKELWQSVFYKIFIINQFFTIINIILFR